MNFLKVTLISLLVIAFANAACSDCSDEAAAVQAEWTDSSASEYVQVGNDMELFYDDDACSSCFDL
jgi:hypothetical protein